MKSKTPKNVEQVLINYIKSGLKKILIIAILVCIGCEKEEPFEQNEIAEVNTKKTKQSLMSKISNTGNVTFNTYDHELNTTAEAETEFDNDINGWDAGVAKVEMYAANKGRLNFEMSPNYGSTNGIVSEIDVSNTDGYQMYFDVKFQSGFDFSRGGKVGFGFAIGEGVTGCNGIDATTNNLGGSFRVLWYDKFDGNGPYLFPYLYHKDMPGTCGSELIDTNRYYITDNQNYRIRLTIKSNSSAATFDGYGKMEISTNYGSNYTTVWEDSSMRWSGSSSSWKRKITNIYFSTFRGGSGTKWNGSQGVQSIYFDNLKWYLYN